MITNKLNGFVMVFLALSVMLIIPLNIGSVYGAENQNTYTEKDNLFDKAATEKQSAANMCGGNLLSNPKDSFVLSALTLCLPGILEKTYEWKYLKCQKIKCMYEAAVKYDMDPSYCAQQYEYSVCKIIVGEVFAMPGLNIIEYFRGMVANILANPVGFLWSKATMLARGVVYGSCQATGGIACHSGINIPYGAATGLLIVTDSLAIYQTLMEIFENGFSFFDETPNDCEDIDKIKKEMEAIVQYS